MYLKHFYDYFEINSPKIIAHKYVFHIISIKEINIKKIIIENYTNWIHEI